MLNLPPIRESLSAAGLTADKRLGQHFLLDLNLTRKIARLAEIGTEDTVIEVGPGPGGLTRALLETGARVIAIERDTRFRPILEELGQAAEGRLELVEADALKVAVEDIAPPGSPIISNLPYNIGTQLLLNWLLGRARPRSLTLMFQREVASRIVAAPTDTSYGRLAVIAQTLCHARIVLEAPARAFTPPPKVDSAVVHLIPRTERLGDDRLQALQSITAAAFGQRRKMLRSSLASLGGGELCESASIAPTRRAETLSIGEFQALADTLIKRQGDRPPTPEVPDFGSDG